MRLFEPVPFRGATHLKIGPPRGRCGRLLQNEQPWDRRLVAPCNTFGGADAKKESRPDVTMSRILPLGFVFPVAAPSAVDLQISDKRNS